MGCSRWLCTLRTRSQVLNKPRPQPEPCVDVTIILPTVTLRHQCFHDTTSDLLTNYVHKQSSFWVNDLVLLCEVVLISIFSAIVQRSAVLSTFPWLSEFLLQRDEGVVTNACYTVPIYRFIYQPPL